MNRYLFSSILCGLLLVLVGQSRGWAQSTDAALVVNRPFPQHVTYAAGTLRPTNFTQAQQDDHVRAFYDYWKQNYLVAAGTNGSGKACTGSPLVRGQASPSQRGKASAW